MSDRGYGSAASSSLQSQGLAQVCAHLQLWARFTQKTYSLYRPFSELGYPPDLWTSPE
jgi:hypothetical protein